MNQGPIGGRTAGRVSLTLCLVLPGDERAQRAVIAFWAVRVKVARADYNAAEVRLRQVVADHRQWPIAEPDGSALLYAARVEEQNARNEYLKVFGIFRHLLLGAENPV